MFNVILLNFFKIFNIIYSTLCVIFELANSGDIYGHTRQKKE